MENNFAVTMLITMLAVNVFLGLVDGAMVSMNPDSAYFMFQNTPAGNMTYSGEINSSFVADYDDVEVDLADSVDVGTGTSFTDSFRSTKTWWDKMNTNFGIASSILRQPAGFMNQIGIPAEICNAFGVIWYGAGILALIYLLTGRT